MKKTTVKIQSKISIKTDREDMIQDFVLKLRPGGLFSNQLGVICPLNKLRLSSWDKSPLSQYFLPGPTTRNIVETKYTNIFFLNVILMICTIMA